MENEISLLKKQIKWLRLSLVGLLVLFILGFCWIFLKRSDFAEITAERINIVEADGTLKMVLSNKHRQHPGSMNGKDHPKRVREAGMIFFNGEGDECGGLVYDSDKENAGMVYSIDKYKDDQVLQLQYAEKTQTHKRKYGLQLWSYGKENVLQERYDRYTELMKNSDKAAQEAALHKMKDEGLTATDRLFVGKTYHDEVGIFLKDAQGRAKIKLFVDSTGNARLELLDDEGKIKLIGN